MPRRKKWKGKRRMLKCVRKKVQELEGAGVLISDATSMQIEENVRQGKAVDAALDNFFCVSETRTRLLNDMFRSTPPGRRHALREEKSRSKFSPNALPVVALQTLHEMFAEKYSIDEIVGAYIDSGKSVDGAAITLLGNQAEVEDRAPALQGWARKAASGTSHRGLLQREAKAISSIANVPTRSEEANSFHLRRRSVFNESNARERALELRSLAEQAHDRMAEAFRSAACVATSGRRGKRSFAGLIAESGRRAQRSRDEQNAEASRLIFAANNRGIDYEDIVFLNADHHRRDAPSFDLHGLYVTECLKIARSLVASARALSWRKIVLVTGRGLHSSLERGPRLLPALRRAFKGKVRALRVEEGKLVVFP